MISIRVAPAPEIVEVEVTGRVKGEPVAIVPRKASDGSDPVRLLSSPFSLIPS